MRISVSDWIAVGTFCLGIAAGWVQMFRHWRGTEDPDTAAFAWLPFGAGVRRGFQRAIPTIVVGMTVLIFYIAAIIVDAEVAHSGESDGRMTKSVIQSTRADGISLGLINL